MALRYTQKVISDSNVLSEDTSINGTLFKKVDGELVPFYPKTEGSQVLMDDGRDLETTIKEEKLPIPSDHGTWLIWKNGEYIDSEKPCVGETGPMGPAGPKGDKGDPGSGSGGGGMFGFQINGDGDLVVTYDDGTTPPTIRLDPTTGELIYTIQT